MWKSKIRIIMLLLLTSSAYVYVQASSEKAILNAPDNQSETSERENERQRTAKRLDDAEKAYQKADERLNVVYKMLMEVYSISKDEESKTTLQKTQLAWIKYRDLAAISEGLETDRGYGRMITQLYSKKSLTEERTSRMKATILRRYQFMQRYKAENPRTQNKSLDSGKDSLTRKYQEQDETLEIALKRMMDTIHKMDAEKKAEREIQDKLQRQENPFEIH